MTPGRLRYAAVLMTIASAFGSSKTSDGNHAPVQCGFPFYGGTYLPQEVKNLNELPATIRESVARHVATRVGPQFVEDVTFDRGQIVNVKELHRINPDSKDYKWQVPTYNLLYQLRLPGREIVRACILLDEGGSAIQELSLPAWGVVQRPAPLITLAEATEIAKANGVPAPDSGAEIRYFRDSDTLEWLFKMKTYDNGLSLGGKTLHVPIQEPSRIHWSTWEAIR